MGRLYDDETDNLLNELNSNLGRQISNELDRKGSRNSHTKNERATGRSTVSGNGFNSRESHNDKDSYLNGDSYRNRGTGMKNNRNKKDNGMIKKILAVVGVVAVAIALVVVFFSNYALDQINYEPDETVIVDTDGKETVIEDIVPSSKDIINILLIGEEAMADSDRGRSDVMMVLTINQKYDRLVVTSFLRDSYVTPPGYSYGSKMNEVYKKGGPSLLVSTIEQNFQIQIDGYARVNFKSFEEIIDLLGGVEIELTEEEAKYLNRTNYISNKKYRNVVPGVQTLNGNQALGYSRVRYVKGINGERDDFGRTNRQRTVINAIFNKYKSKGLFELVGVTNKILPHITTNMTKKDILSYLSCAAGMLGKVELETFRVPMDNAYAGQKINGKAVLVINFERVQAALQDEMYGEGYLEENDTTGASWTPPANTSSSSSSSNKGSSSSSSSSNKGSSTTSSNSSNTGSNTNTGNDSNIETDTKIEEDPSIGTDTNVGEDPSIGTDTNIGEDPSIGTDTNIGEDPSIGTDTNVGEDPSIGTDTNVGEDPSIGTDTNTESNPSTGTDMSTGSSSNTGTDTSTGSSSNTGIDTNTGNGVSTGTDTNTRNDASTESNSNVGSDPSAGSNSSTEDDLSVGSNSSTGNNPTIVSDTSTETNTATKADTNAKTEISNEASTPENNNTSSTTESTKKTNSETVNTTVEKVEPETSNTETITEVQND